MDIAGKLDVVGLSDLDFSGLSLCFWHSPDTALSSRVALVLIHVSAL
jgi:hypothetical protein